MFDLFVHIKKLLRQESQPIRVVFPEGTNDLIQKVAVQLTAFNIEPLLVFARRDQMPAQPLPPAVRVAVMTDYDTNALAEQLFVLRQTKITAAQAQTLISDPIYFAMMLLKNHKVNALVGGINYPTSAVIRPALQIIRAKPDHKLVSSVFLMIKGDQRFIFTDCALNIDPTATQLATIARLSYQAAHLLQVKCPRIALLSYATYQSGQGVTVDKVRTAVTTLRTQNWQCCEFDGPLQLDSALNQMVRRKKAPGSPLSGNANILVFPGLDAANIGYKLVQRLGGFQAIGPILVGLNQPVNDLSRGASESDILNTVLVTAYEWLINRHERAD